MLDVVGLDALDAILQDPDLIPAEKFPPGPLISNRATAILY
jgi:hypothetical protein